MLENPKYLVHMDNAEVIQSFHSEDADEEASWRTFLCAPVKSSTSAVFGAAFLVRHCRRRYQSTIRSVAFRGPDNYNITNTDRLWDVVAGVRR
ncbi:hypothetical protein RvY_00227 [Ramazzottius varieornatus]|uniref:Uncharacterized protein n=1 Tax=Ramazzottius varieornatus TaxID=947166 RepID=A0A1D1UCZ4_RAMVA|nr:hypothetical protein RvY_00227 [Ramazzottius varieornatus]